MSKNVISFLRQHGRKTVQRFSFWKYETDYIESLPNPKIILSLQYLRAIYVRLHEVRYMLIQDRFDIR